jgi:hypothetical protein
MSDHSDTLPKLNLITPQRSGHTEELETDCETPMIFIPSYSSNN